MNYLALDIGNVLCHIDQVPFSREISESLNITISEADRFVSRFWELHDIGFTNINDELIDRLGVKSPIKRDKIIALWNAVISPNETVIDFINQLKSDYNVKIAFVSNMGIEHVKIMNTILGKGGLYSDAIKYFSCDVGARKPSYLYYQSFLSMYPEFKGCMYVDDRQKNVEAASLFDFKSYKFSLEDYFPFQAGVKTLEEELQTLKLTFLEINKLL